MSEPSLSSTGAGAGLVTLVTLALGPILGEYAIIVGFSLLGTLMALSETVQPSVGKSLLFLIRGVTLGFVFTGIVTSVVVKYSPGDLGLTPYFVMGGVAFVIGWFSNRIGSMKDAILVKVTAWLGK